MKKTPAHLRRLFLRLGIDELIQFRAAVKQVFHMGEHGVLAAAQT
jgi:hypothetical protein